jgi:hypothetical protein
MVLLEKYFAPALRDRGLQDPPSYFIYTDNLTHASVSSRLASCPCMAVSPLDVAPRSKLVNLDTDPSDALHRGAISSLPLDAVNAASVRRTLADGEHLPEDAGRLLLGTDVQFRMEPRELVERMFSIAESDRGALYMADGITWGGKLYTLEGYSGPQCAGLLGDFVYLSPSTSVSSRLLLEKIMWYVRAPRKTSPPCPCCPGYHAVDQFALALAVGDAVEPRGGNGKGCMPLSLKHYTHVPRGEPPSLAEVTHYKLSTEGLQTCGMRYLESLYLKLMASTAILFFIAFIVTFATSEISGKMQRLRMSCMQQSLTWKSFV